MSGTPAPSMIAAAVCLRPWGRRAPASPRRTARPACRCAPELGPGTGHASARRPVRARRSPPHRRRPRRRTRRTSRPAAGEGLRDRHPACASALRTRFDLAHRGAQGPPLPRHVALHREPPLVERDIAPGQAGHLAAAEPCLACGPEHRLGPGRPGGADEPLGWSASRIQATAALSSAVWRGSRRRAAGFSASKPHSTARPRITRRVATVCTTMRRLEARATPAAGAGVESRRVVAVPPDSGGQHARRPREPGGRRRSRRDRPRSGAPPPRP